MFSFLSTSSLWRLSAAFGLACLAAAHALPPPIEMVPLRESAWTQSLNGSWKFRYAAGPADPSADAFAKPAFDDHDWASLSVPAHWELNGFAPPKYGRVDQGVGYYRRTFSLPENWKGQRVMLRFEGVLYGCQVWVNGEPIGEWASSYNPATFDLTDALKPGAKNVLAVRVDTHPKGWEFDTNDCWALSGIYRDVTLFAVPPLHFQRTIARTTLDDQGQAHLHIVAWLAGAPVSPAVQILGRLRGPDGARGPEFKLPLKNTQGEITLVIPHPKLWTAETPDLYKLELTLEAPGQRSQVLEDRVGLRQVTIKDGLLQLNGRPIKLRGVDHHDIWPEEGRVATEARMRRDLELIQAANCNFIRTSHYPPHPRLLELCDELGLYVMDEVPFGFGDEHLKEPSYQDILLTRGRATLLRDENRPSVIIWSVGNENPNTPLTLATGARVKELDPTRPICFPQVGSYFAKSYEELPSWVDVYAPHYPDLETIRNYAQHLTRPIIFSEYAHALGLATDRIQDAWAIMQASPRIAGGAVWMFQDQGILRTSDKAVEQLDRNPYVWLDAHHYYDTNKLDGMDGIVYSDRTPQTDYWEVRKVYSPVQFAVTGNASLATSGLAVEVKNRFDFRSLAGLTLEWTLLRNREAIANGKESLQAAAQATETVKLAWSPLTADPFDFYYVRLRCLDPNGRSLFEKVVRLEPEAPSNRFDALLPKNVSKELRLEETPSVFRVTHANFIAELDRQTGELTLRDPKGELLARGPWPHTGRTRLTSTEELRAKRDNLWLGAVLRSPAHLETSATEAPEGITLQVHGEYPRNTTEGQALAGGYDAVIRPNGAIEFTYDYRPTHATGHFIEAGVSFFSAPAASEFRWVGAGPYAGYPGKDALNDWGIFHLNREDLSFGGNRRETELAVLSTGSGNGFALVTPPSDIAVETTPEGVLLSHNALLAGRGNKGVQAETTLDVSKIQHISGHFSLVALSSNWPEALIRWIGASTETAAPHHPFYRSYDQ